MHPPTTEISEPNDKSFPPLAPFVKVPRNVVTGMIERHTLLTQPSELFCSFFGGRMPTFAEKIQFVESAVQRMASQNIYENDLYHVEILYSLPFIHLNIRRRDGEPCKEWRHFQEIKNALIGPEFEAVELFPAESRLVDTSNEYHLWVCADRSFRFPFGFPQRWVLDQPMTVPSGPDTAPSNVGGRATPVPTDRVARQPLQPGAVEEMHRPVPAHSDC